MASILSPRPGIDGHELTLLFLVNDIFMVLFFGIAAKEITESCLPGSSLNPMKKAINPLMAGFIAALGLTVALFVATAAFIDPVLQGQAKMGALFSGFVGLAAILIARMVSAVKSSASEADDVSAGVGVGDHMPVPMAAKGPDE